MSNPESSSTVRRRAPVPRADCALAQATEEIGDRWSLLILREAFFGVMRYDDIREDLGIPRSVLTDRLAKLVARGLLEKRPYREAGDRQRFGYSLTEKGRNLALTFIALTHWSEAHVLGALGPIEIVDQETGRGLRVALVDDEGRIVPAERAVPKVRVQDG
ncbi:winged helix-turn-helix transcriptional regulator [Jannaschia seohaensis]|uniref:DNA-binding HxlR family transcriptional regulator n=1 Tax=Jannaschia seohaensis TaxID=475081 RepID=A0A2Y9AJ07_9RHOB|nr:helix-turn-helix domain-containing protein [Jannaschia seohaensis]PWJ20275.1 DNA-binding HxlR family transcriptional regulator [Jannaschia seohaensis]SSA44290.1 DNA-binding transcriptional regulator, HxlR family [Jannaschia seohaensis]